MHFVIINPANDCPPEAAAVQTVEEVQHRVDSRITLVILRTSYQLIDRLLFFTRSIEQLSSVVVAYLGSNSEDFSDLLVRIAM